jgi:hypothetical protein
MLPAPAAAAAAVRVFPYWRAGLAFQDQPAIPHDHFYLIVAHKTGPLERLNSLPCQTALERGGTFVFCMTDSRRDAACPRRRPTLLSPAA